MNPWEISSKDLLVPDVGDVSMNSIDLFLKYSLSVQFNSKLLLMVLNTNHPELPLKELNFLLTLLVVHSLP
jgi:hypothetical protein